MADAAVQHGSILRRRIQASSEPVRQGDRELLCAQFLPREVASPDDLATIHPGRNLSFESSLKDVGHILLVLGAVHGDPRQMELAWIEVNSHLLAELPTRPRIGGLAGMGLTRGQTQGWTVGIANHKHAISNAERHMAAAPSRTKNPPEHQLGAVGDLQEQADEGIHGWEEYQLTGARAEATHSVVHLARFASAS